MPSPTCQVKEGAGAYGPTDHGVDVSGGSTITIDLVDKSVDSWTITCLTTDELSDKTVPNAALAASINPVTKRATFIAPADAVGGRTYRFQSTVDSGTDANGRPRASYTTTFCVYVPVVASGRRCLAADEEVEGDPDFGWTASINSVIRSPNGTLTQPLAALDVDWSTGDTFTKTLAAGANTLTFSNMRDGQIIVVVLIGAASTVVWPTVEWPGGVVPMQTASGKDVYTFIRVGSTTLGTVVQDLS